MGRLCSICQHEYRDSIDAAIVSGDSQKLIAERFGVGADAVRRHGQNHLSAALAAMRTQEQAERRATLLDRIEMLIERGEAMFAAAAGEGHAAQALNVLRELRGLLELYGRASGEIDDRPQVTINLLTMPEVAAAIAVVYGELADLPEVRQRIAARLQGERLQIEAPS